MDTCSGLYLISVKWYEGPNPKIFIAATRDEVPVRGSPAPITWTVSPALLSILAQGFCVNMLEIRPREGGKAICNGKYSNRGVQSSRLSGYVYQKWNI